LRLAACGFAACHEQSAAVMNQIVEPMRRRDQRFRGALFSSGRSRKLGAKDAIDLILDLPQLRLFLDASDTSG